MNNDKNKLVRNPRENDIKKKFDENTEFSEEFNKHINRMPDLLDSNKF